MYPETLITSNHIGLIILAVAAIFLAGVVLVASLNTEKEAEGLFTSVMLGGFGALIFSFCIISVNNTYKSLIEEPDCAYYYIGAEYFTTKPSATEGMYDHYFVDENGELWSFETDFPSYDTNFVYLLCIDDMGTPNEIYDDEVMVVWSTK